MGNSYFRFKQFTVQQDRCAMKVCTDACLFGAWLAAGWNGDEDRILDIGTGTGLLSLMLAQRFTATIHALEIDESAAAQAVENFEASSWSRRLQVIRADARSWRNSERYGLVVSNPPFFENDLRSVDPQRNLALHSSALSLEALLETITAQCAEDGKFALLLPYHRKDFFVQLAEARGFFCEKEADVRQTETHERFRTMMVFGKGTGKCMSELITIREGDAYSNRFRELLKDYYLYL